ncbi:NADH dehydrogenase [ubiquinone] 1 alpha subcomplex subunit 2 isoform X1 [Stegostoma tigrinum]|uniref:NADH dehydrogenase [ubiquinone] 1 alpha subcomplex subunit 2 isoform X1 n=1 Tax=Stegostoma tigrinum TaxID=3053191 RepID=UPI00202B41C2|nr:NADH dehydrogenase [ubiquinone] 1 alpha subcomplex subunit 2 isoform X1 [Stegostoma tigrinum]
MAAAVVRGVGSKLSQNLRELRIHLCQSSAASKGTRDFIEQHYVALKKANPEFPILIRECAGVQSKMWARYGFESGSLEHYLDLWINSKERILASPEELVIIGSK